jgi:hypothetical protein
MSAAKRKGTAFESLIRNAMNNSFLSRTGIRAYRPAQEGFKDVGDIHGVSPFIIQAKNWKDLGAALREGVDGAVIQSGNADEDYGVAVIKRPRHSVGDAYAVMRFEDFCRILSRLRRAETLLARSSTEAYAHHCGATLDDKAADFPKASQEPDSV